MQLKMDGSITGVQFLNAIDSGNSEYQILAVVQRCIAANKHNAAAINITNYWGYTALSLAAAYGYAEVVQALLNCNLADITIKNTVSGTTAEQEALLEFELTASEKYAVIVGLLSSMRINIDNFFQAIKQGNLVSIESYISHCKNKTVAVNVTDKMGETPLNMSLLKLPRKQSPR